MNRQLNCFGRCAEGLGVRFAIVGPAYPMRGGIAAHVDGLASRLEEEGHDVLVMGFARLYPSVLFPGKSQFVDGALHQSVKLAATRQRVSEIDSLKPRSWTRARDRIREFKPESIVTEYWHPAFAPIVRAVVRNVPSVRKTLLCHNAQPHESFPGARLALRVAAGGYDDVICHSNYVADALRALTGGRHGAEPSVCEMPVLLDPFRERLLRGSFSVQDDGIDPISEGLSVIESIARNKIVVVCPGHVRDYKGTDDLTAAWRRLASEASRTYNAELLVVGEHYVRDSALIAPNAASDSMRFINRYVGDLELLAWLARASIVVLPYNRASQSGFVPIAKALGRRIVASDAGGLAEQTLGYDKLHRFRAGDRAALAEALGDALASEKVGRADALSDDGASRQALPSSESWHALVRASWNPLVEVLVNGRGVIA